MKERILIVAMRLAKRTHYKKVFRKHIAREADISVGLVNYHFETMEALRLAVMRRAVETEQLDIIAQGLVDKHPCAVQAPAALRVRALQSLV